ncbi:MAG: hypothetical protein ACLQF0_17010 [Dissulfurispiraceae bacterium]
MDGTNKQSEMEDLDIRDDTLRRDRWRRTYCQICGREYLYLVMYKPETCQTLACALKLREKKRGNGNGNHEGN